MLQNLHKIFETQNMQNQTNLKYFSNPKDIFKSAKKKKKKKKKFNSLKLFNLPHLNGINFDMNLSIQM